MKRFIKVKLQMVLINISRILGQKLHLPQPALTCSKLTIETLEQDVKYVQR